jgi:hypothetical protein
VGILVHHYRVFNYADSYGYFRLESNPAKNQQSNRASRQLILDWPYYRNYEERNMKHQPACVIQFLILCACICALVSTASMTYAQVREEFMPPAADGKTWKLTWNDEFEGRKIDTSKWEIIGDSKRRDGYWVKEDS